MERDNFNEYFEVWLKGIKDEIFFWKNYMEKKGGAYFYGWEETISPVRKFELEAEIPKNKFGKRYRFADIGSGAFSRCGRNTNKVELEAVYIDPLGSVYEKLKVQNGIKDSIECETGFVELLDKKFGENAFDMVHMSNSLDHCFDAVYGIYQLLYICNVGGQVILRHHENEAEKEEYAGLHQWNLSLHNPENSFIIWREDKRYDICEIFKEYAEIKLYPDQIEERGWVYNKVIMIKKKNISIPANQYYEQMMWCIYNYLLNILLDEKVNRDIEESWTEKLYGKMSRVYFKPEILQKKLEERKIDKVVIYGMGEIGKRTIQLFLKCKIDILTVIDNQKLEYMGIQSVSLTEFKNMRKFAPLIVIAIKNEKEKIREELEEMEETKGSIIQFIEELI